MIRLNIHKTLKAADGILNLQIEQEIKVGEFVVVYGKSGAGKTSLLRMLAGLLDPDSGSIVVNNEPWFNKAQKINLYAQKRNIGFVFQDLGLFPNMTVRQHLRYALPKDQSENIIDELLEMVELTELANRKPATLSGGQQQRLALARSLVQHPKILLLDEPLSALDDEIRFKLQEYLQRIHQKYALTILMVSHEISEVVRLASRVLKIENGQIVADASPDELFGHSNISGKFQFQATIIKIVQEDFLYIISLLIGKELVRIVADEKEAMELNVGDKVLVASKAFNPIIKKLG